jgi:hypothetical protein
MEAVMYTRWVFCLVVMIGLSAGAAAQERSTKDGDKDPLSLKGRKGQGKIGDSHVTFDFRENGDLVITGKLKGKGTWTQTGATVFMETAVSTFEGTLRGNRASGQRTLKENKRSVSEWSAQFGETASETSYIEDHSVEATWVTIAIVAGLVLVIVISVCAVQWARVRRAEAEARVKQDMLARGLSVEEIERLSTPASVRQAQIAADAQVKEAQLAADLKRDMLARGLSVEEVERLLTPKSPAVSRRREEANALASAIVKMVEGEGNLDFDAVAGLLATFLEKDAGVADRLGQSQPAPHMAPATQTDSGPREKGSPEIKRLFAEPGPAPDRPRE